MIGFRRLTAIKFEIANDSPYGLAAYVQAADRDAAVAVASRIDAGMVHVNSGPISFELPFGGVKRSGLAI